MKIQYIVIFAFIFFWTACETDQKGFQNGYNQATTLIDADTKTRMDRLTRNGTTLPSSRELEQEIDPSHDCGPCEARRSIFNANRGSRDDGDDWDDFVAGSTYERFPGGMAHSGPWGKVEWYNGSHDSLPGGRGAPRSLGVKFLSREILDIVPKIAEAHKKFNHSMRVSSTTGGRHSRNSKHYKGNAIDVDPDPESRKMDIAREIHSKLGCGYWVYVEPTHIHIEIRPGCHRLAVK